MNSINEPGLVSHGDGHPVSTEAPSPPAPVGAAKDSQTAVPPEETASLEQMKRKALARKLRAARALASRMQVLPDGSRVFLRFNRAQRREHQILIITFTTLAVTGLLQRYSENTVLSFIISILGGIDTLRVFHHLAAIVFILQSLYHVGIIASVWFVKRELGSMWPRWKDLTDLLQMLKFNLGLTGTRPEFDRFSIEEKLEYWALLWGTPLMILTGVMMWFPIQVTRFLPGDAIPVSRAIHAWEAILATLAILTWHMYHTVIKQRNRSIFTGFMTEAEMKHEHPLEYRRILTAYEYLQSIGAKESLSNVAPAKVEVVKPEAQQKVVQNIGPAN